MKVSVKPIPGDVKGRKMLVAEKDFEPGEIIYKVFGNWVTTRTILTTVLQELPVVAVLDPDLEGQGTYCSHCLRSIEQDKAIRPESDRFDSAYCSEDCRERAKIQTQNLLFGLDAVLPPELDQGQSELTKPARDEVQKKFADYIKEQGRSVLMLSSRFVARQVAIETAKMAPNKTGVLARELEEAQIGGTEYSLYDHMERLRFTEGKVSEEETKLLCAVLGAALPGLEQSVTDERFATYQGKMAYNAIGICYNDGRDDKVRECQGFMEWH